jgi:chromosome partitioning protein
VNVWAVANQKGGVGKTTTAVSLAGVLAARGMNTLLVDLDPHGSLTSYFRWDPDTLTDTVYRLFIPGTDKPCPNPEELLRETGVPGIHVLPASRGLATLDKQLSGREGMGLVLHHAVNSLSTRIDHVLLDCPPVFGVLMLNALAACHSLIIPVQTEFLALKGLERMLHTLGMVSRARKRPLDYWVVPTLYDQRTRASRDSLEELRTAFAGNLWPGLIPVDTRFRDASRVGQPLTTLDPRARGARAYEALLDHLLGGNTGAAPEEIPSARHPGAAPDTGPPLARTNS